ncbi:hypothetical protein KXD40_002689 [Peronospora effusa]|uniref:TAZ-type domain-containing protein n=1 Tax=Peronospora effusa TaxID=542832 RepID=A0A3M6VSU4_9STRA|nr:hypothetical protein DD238_002733 [Peronospora effusa]UIZ29725.1 hypothetical protein KXD40_002689 [Peronospora effusa]
MSWPEEPQSHNGNGEYLDAELHESSYFYPMDGSDERSQHGTTNFLSANHGVNHVGLTYSASCPSFSGLDDVDDLSGGAVGSNGLMSYPYGSQEPLVDTVSSDGNTLFTGDKTLEMLLQFQQDYQTTSQRQFPRQHVMGQPIDLVQQQMAGERRGLHGSQSLTNLSSMMDDSNGINANSKRKKETERWMKLQRHKSFDSTASISESVDLDPHVTFGIPLSSLTPTPDQLLQGPPHSDMIGFCASDLSNSMQTDGSNWPPVAYGSAPSSIGGNYMQQAHHRRHCHQQEQADVQSLSDAGGDTSVCTSAEVGPASELDMLLSDNERANLFDAIRKFESPGGLEPISAQPVPKQVQRSTQILSQTESKGQNQIFKAETKTTTVHSPVDSENHKKFCHYAERPLSLDSSATLSAGMPPSGCVSMRTRLHQILVLSVQNSDAGSSLSSYERNYLMQSPLFFPARAPETAGSLWLLLHAAQCESGCEIAGCSVMRRVLTHCLGCELVVGKCKQPCNDAKAMLLHYGSCNSKGSMHGRSCSVCWNLLEIDISHQALSNGNGGGKSSGQTSNSAPSSFVATSPSPQTGTPSLVPVSVSPGWGGSTAYRSPSRRSTSRSGTSKHVPIQPNPLPTASNPMGLMGALPPQFGHPLSLYLEQTSASFRAEVKSRVEKRVTAAAGQDLLQHMQKKTRLRSLDNLRLEARTTVLGEMERELHRHMQAYNWANITSGENVPEGALQLFPYLTNFSLAEFGAFQAQQLTSQTSKPPAAFSSSPSVRTRRSGSYEFAPNDSLSKERRFFV